MEEVTDARVIARSLDEPAVFAALFDRHYDSVHRYLARRVGPDIAAELASETFTTAFDVRRRYDPGRSDARPWLFGIATNLVRHHRRSEGRRLRAYARLDALGIPRDRKGHSSRAIIDACRPFERLKDFPMVARATPELRQRVAAKFKDVLSRI